MLKEWRLKIECSFECENYDFLLDPQRHAKGRTSQHRKGRPSST